jgi:nifR3 family TIM-barrel protein
MTNEKRTLVEASNRSQSAVDSSPLKTAAGSFKIGDVVIEHPFTLAALAGYSDVGMRVTCRELGASMTRHEVVLDRLVVEGAKGARGGRHLTAEDHPIAAQLMGNSLDDMPNAAEEMVSLGYDMIDVNFGCPVKKVLGRCRGGYLLSEPDRAIALVEAIVKRVDVPVTLKMRRGLDDSAESEANFYRILERSLDLGVAGVTVHGRTVMQRYDGPSNWDFLKRVRDRFPRLCMLGSGDLFTAEDSVRMVREVGVDGVTIARGSIENPWIFREAKALFDGSPKPPPPTLAEQRALFDRQYRLCVAQYGPERASRQIRKFGIKRAPLHPDPEGVRKAVIAVANSDDWDRMLDRYYPAS